MVVDEKMTLRQAEKEIENFNKVVCLVGYNVLERMRFSAQNINDASFRKRRQHTHNAQLESMIFPAYLTRRAPCIKIVLVGIHQLWTVGIHL